MFWSETQSSKSFSINVFWFVLMMKTTEFIDKPARSHLLMILLNIDINVFFLWLIKGKTQLNEMNLSIKWAIQLVSSNLLLRIVKSKCRIWYDFVALPIGFWFINWCIFDTAQIVQSTVLKAMSLVLMIFKLSYFFNWSITSERQCSRRKCHIQKIILTWFRDCIEFVKIWLDIELNSKIVKPKCFWISHITASEFLSTSTFSAMFQWNFFFFSILADIILTFELRIYATLWNKKSRGFLYLIAFTIMISFSTARNFSSDVSTHVSSLTEVIFFTKRL